MQRLDAKMLQIGKSIRRSLTVMAFVTNKVVSNSKQIDK